MRVDIVKLYEEVETYVNNLKTDEDGEHLWSNYQEVIGYLVRLTQIHNEIAFLELQNNASPQVKKFRTTIIDPTIERLEKIAAFESRKITAKSLEITMER